MHSLCRRRAGTSTQAELDLTLNSTLNTEIFFLRCEVSEMRDRRVDLWSFFLFFFPLFFQFAYHLLHLPLLTPEGLRGDFDLNRKSRVVRLRISSSLNSAGKTLEPCLDSQAGFTGASFSQESWFDLEGAAVFA